MMRWRAEEWRSLHMQVGALARAALANPLTSLLKTVAPNIQV
jgi:hypothetical protein